MHFGGARYAARLRRPGGGAHSWREFGVGGCAALADHRALPRRGSNVDEEGRRADGDKDAQHGSGLEQCLPETGRQVHKRVRHPGALLLPTRWLWPEHVGERGPGSHSLRGRHWHGAQPHCGPPRAALVNQVQRGWRVVSRPPQAGERPRALGAFCQAGGGCHDKASHRVVLHLDHRSGTDPESSQGPSSEVQGVTGEGKHRRPGGDSPCGGGLGALLSEGGFRPRRKSSHQQEYVKV